MLLFLIFAKSCNIVQLKTSLYRIRFYSYFSIFILSSLVGWYSGWIFPLTSDRGNYAFRFTRNYYVDGTYGLRWISMFLRKYTDNPQILFFTVSFLCVFITLIAVNKYEYKSKLLIGLLIASMLFPSTFYLLKQAPAVAFSTLAIPMFFRKKMVTCMVLTFTAILFHETAVILLPLYIVMLGSKKRWIRIIEYISLLVFLIFFRQIAIHVLPTVNLVDYIGSQTSGFEESILASQGISNLQTTIKGIPIYIITVYAIFKRKHLKTHIKDYDKFLLLCCVGSICVLLSAYIYWMFRFAMYCYLSIYVFASLIQKEIKTAIERRLFLLSICGPLIYFTLRFMLQINLSG